MEAKWQELLDDPMYEWEFRHIAQERKERMMALLRYLCIYGLLFLI
jgi:hypothetical protein